ncbi:alpha/beta hydrolase [Roseimaritima multifibrata]|nr:lysophospholipase [Roseimaritima multifibrata]
MMQAYETKLGPLNCIVIDGEQPASVGVVVCHGYGAPGEDLVPLGAQWVDLLGEDAERCRFVFPAAPFDLADLGMPMARAWWPLNMQRLMDAMDAEQFDELHQHEPAGLDVARKALSETIEALVKTLDGPNPSLILGGFSQGAMLAMDTALRGIDKPPAVLMQMSGTLICQPIWEPLLSTRLANTKVLQSHGTSDPILPYSSAEALYQLLKNAELDVRFMSFAGPHTIGPDMNDALVAEIQKQLQAT